MVVAVSVVAFAGDERAAYLDAKVHLHRAGKSGAVLSKEIVRAIRSGEKFPGIFVVAKVNASDEGAGRIDRKSKGNGMDCRVFWSAEDYPGIVLIDGFVTQQLVGELGCDILEREIGFDDVLMQDHRLLFH